MTGLPVIILPQAKADIGRAASYLEDARPGHGQAFIRQLYATLLHIRAFPESCQRFHGDCRRSVLHRFRQAVVYRVLPGRIEVVGIMHDSRSPERWTARIDN